MGSTEETYRAFVFNKNVEQINLLNKDPLRTAELGVNQYTDLTPEEFKAKLLTLIPPKDLQVNSQLSSEQERPIVGAATAVVPSHLRSLQERPIVGAATAKVTPVDHSVAKSTTNPFPPPVRNQGNCAPSYAFAALTELAFATSFQKKASVIYSVQ